MIADPAVPLGGTLADGRSFVRSGSKGQVRPTAFTTDRTSRGLLHAETCRMAYEHFSARAAGGALRSRGQLCNEDQPLAVDAAEWSLSISGNECSRP